MNTSIKATKGLSQKLSFGRKNFFEISAIVVKQTT